MHVRAERAIADGFVAHDPSVLRLGPDFYAPALREPRPGQALSCALP